MQAEGIRAVLVASRLVGSASWKSVSACHHGALTSGPPARSTGQSEPNSMNILTFLQLLAAVVTTKALQLEDVLLPVLHSARDLKEFVLPQQMPEPQDLIKHSVGTAKTAVVDGRPTPVTYATLCWREICHARSCGRPFARTQLHDLENVLNHTAWSKVTKHIAQIHSSTVLYAQSEHSWYSPDQQSLVATTNVVQSK
jgi:hypothetical protein